jgi:hypothetical protein
MPTARTGEARRLPSEAGERGTRGFHAASMFLLADALQQAGSIPDFGGRREAPVNRSEALNAAKLNVYRKWAWMHRASAC